MEAGAFFERYQREGKMSSAQGERRMGGRLLSAVDYLQSQRTRSMMMADLFGATKHVDCYVVASPPSRGIYSTPPKPGSLSRGPGGGESPSAQSRHASTAPDNISIYNSTTQFYHLIIATIVRSRYGKPRHVPSGTSSYVCHKNRPKSSGKLMDFVTYMLPGVG